MLPSIYGQTASLAATDPSLIQAALQQTPPSTINSGSPASSDNLPTGSRDTTLTKIFVGGLPYHTTDQTLHDYFRQFGEIEEAVVITDRQTQKSRGYGFVTMKERADAEKACRDPNPIIDGRKANVNLAYLGAKPRNNVHLAALQQQLNHQLQQTQQQTPTALVQAIQLQALLQQHQQMQSIPTRLGLPINQLHAVNAPTSTFGTSLNHSTLAASQLNSLSPATLALLQQQQIATNHQAALFAAATGTAGTTGYFDYNQLLLAASSQPSASLAYNVPSAQGTSIDHGSSAASLIAANAYALHALAVAGGGSGTAHNVYKTTPKQDYE